MAYTIDFSDPLKTPFSIPDSTPETSETTLSLYGAGSIGWGESVNENFLHILETFSSASPPSNPINGQMWVQLILYVRNTNTGLWYQCDPNATPASWGNVTPDLVQPGAPINGQLWFDGTTLSMWFDDEGVWKERKYQDQTTAPTTQPPTQILSSYDSYLDEWIPASTPSRTSTAPLNPVEGQLWYDNVAKQVKYWDGSVWSSLESSTTPQMPTGAIIMWSGLIGDVPAGWVVCDGNNGTPNLTDRFIVGAGGSLGVVAGATGGSHTVTLSASNLPSHTHTYSGTTNTVGNHTHSGSTSAAGTINITIQLDINLVMVDLCPRQHQLQH